MATFEILVHEQQKLVRATLQGDTIRVESGALHYWHGNIQMQSKAPSAGGFLKRALTGENAFRPTYTGTGEVFIGPPYFGEFLIIECTEGHPGWILDRGAYLCSDSGVQVTVHQNTAMNALLGGEGLFQTKVHGRGKVVIRAQGTVNKVNLVNDTIAVDGRFAVAREATLDYQVKRATQSLVGSVTSGEGLLQFISGTGQVMLAPVPDLQQALIDEIGGRMPLTEGGSGQKPNPLAIMVILLLVMGGTLIPIIVGIMAAVLGN